MFVTMELDNSSQDHCGTSARLKEIILDNFERVPDENLIIVRPNLFELDHGEYEWKALTVISDTNVNLFGSWLVLNFYTDCTS